MNEVDKKALCEISVEAKAGKKKVTSHDTDRVCKYCHGPLVHQVYDAAYDWYRHDADVGDCDYQGLTVYPEEAVLVMEL